MKLRMNEINILFIDKCSNDNDASCPSTDKQVAEVGGRRYLAIDIESGRVKEVHDEAIACSPNQIYQYVFKHFKKLDREEVDLLLSLKLEKKIAPVQSKSTFNSLAASIRSVFSSLEERGVNQSDSEAAPFFKDGKEAQAKIDERLKIPKKLRVSHPSDLMSAAIEYLTSASCQERQAPVVDFSTLNNFYSDEDLIVKLFEQSRGFCAGEKHNEETSKKFFIKNMEVFKKHHVTVIGFEGIDYTEQETLDAYLTDRYQGNPEMEKKVEALMEKVRNFINPFNPDYRSEKVLEAAKKYGIRVVGLDVPRHLRMEQNSEKEVNIQERLPLMNFTASVVMEEILSSMKENEKFVCLMGYKHVIRDQELMSIPGVADLLQCPAINFKKNSFQFMLRNQKKLGDFSATLLR